jgi:hypothetical protein
MCVAWFRGPDMPVDLSPIMDVPITTPTWERS